MYTFLIEKAFLWSLVHNDVFARNGFGEVNSENWMLKKYCCLEDVWELFAENQADVEIKTACMIWGNWAELVENRDPWKMFHCLNIGFHSVICSFKDKTFLGLKELWKAVLITGHRFWNKDLQTGWLVIAHSFSPVTDLSILSSVG